MELEIHPAFTLLLLASFGACIWTFFKFIFGLLSLCLWLLNLCVQLIVFILSSIVQSITYILYLIFLWIPNAIINFRAGDSTYLAPIIFWLCLGGLMFIFYNASMLNNRPAPRRPVRRPTVGFASLAPIPAPTPFADDLLKTPAVPKLRSRTSTSLDVGWSYPEDSKDKILRYEVNWLEEFNAKRTKWEQAFLEVKTPVDEICYSIENLQPEKPYRVRVRLLKSTSASSTSSACGEQQQPHKQLECSAWSQIPRLCYTDTDPHIKSGDPVYLRTVAHRNGKCEVGSRSADSIAVLVTAAEKTKVSIFKITGTEGPYFTENDVVEIMCGGQYLRGYVTTSRLSWGPRDESASARFILTRFGKAGRLMSGTSFILKSVRWTSYNVHAKEHANHLILDNSVATPSQFQVMKQNLGDEDPTPAGSSSNSQTVEDKSCVICDDAQRDAVLVPCGHLAVCMVCAKKLSPKVCPICRAGISQITKVYHA